MTEDQEDNSGSPEEPEKTDEATSPAGGKKLRHRTIRFVLLFAVLVIAMITGYRYAVDTEANMWYLFQVARSTAWTLDIVGDSASVEPNPDGHSVFALRKRTELAKWRGREPEEGSLSEDPLTPWESWLYKAYTLTENDRTIENHGPTVHVVIKQGLVSRSLELRREIARLLKDDTTDLALRDAELSRVQAESLAVNEELKALPKGDASNDARRDLQFSFQVVPDCGAIPSISIFIAAVLAFPAPIRHRIIGLIVGTAMLYVINVGRLSTLAYIGAVDTSPGSKWFHFVHEYIWQGIFIIFVVAVWMAWIELVVRIRRT